MLADYFVSKNLYQSQGKKSLEYHQAQFLAARLGETYPTETDLHRKWDAFVAQFITDLSDEPITQCNRELVRSFEESLKTFGTSRKNASKDNVFVLGLDKSLAYFEAFYFICLNQDKAYQITPEERKKLLHELIDAMKPGICETGISARLESLLFSARKDADWINNELIKQQRMLIEQMAEAYNTEYQIGNALSIHTVSLMSKLAYQEWGIAKNRLGIEDPYLDLEKELTIKTFFRYRFPEYQLRFEHHCVENLSVYLFSELHRHLKTLGYDIESRPHLTDKQLEAVYQFLKDHLSQYTDLSYHDFFEFDDDVTSVSATVTDFKLKSSDEVLQSLTCALRTILIARRMIVPYQQLKQLDLDDYSIKCPKGLLGVLKKLIVKLKNADSYQQVCGTFSKSEHQLFEKYPGLVIGLLDDPHYWGHLPPSIKAIAEVREAFIERLSQLIQKQLEHGEHFQENFDLLWQILKSNTELVGILPQGLLSNQQFALKLVEKEGRLIQWLSEGLRAESQILHRAALQNIAALEYKPQVINYAIFNPKYHLMMTNPRLLGPSAKTHLCQWLSQAQNLYILTHQSEISFRELLKLTQNLKPSQLEEAIKIREEKKFTALPGCDLMSLRTFAKYAEEISWENGFWGVKKYFESDKHTRNSHPFLSSEYCALFVKQSLAKSNQWLLAYREYSDSLTYLHRPFENWADVFKQMRTSVHGLSYWTVKHFSKILKNVTLLALIVGGYLYIPIPSLFSYLYGFYLQQIISLGLFQSIGLSILGLSSLVLLSWYIGNRFPNFSRDFRRAISALLVSPNIQLLNIPVLLVTSLLGQNFLIWAGIFAVLVYAHQSLAIMLMLTTLPILYITLRSMIKIGSYVLGFELAMGQIDRFVNRLVDEYVSILYFLELKLLTPVIRLFVDIIKNVMTWPEQFNLIFSPWIQRSYANLSFVPAIFSSSNKDVISDAILKLKIEEVIDQLERSADYSANQKGELLASLWRMIQQDVQGSEGRLSFRQALTKSYRMEWDGQSKPWSFADVASMFRTKNQPFKPTVAKSNWSFFGVHRQTETYHQIEDLVAPLP